MKIRYKMITSFLLIVVLFLASGLIINNNIMAMTSADKQVNEDFAIYQQARNYEKGSMDVQVGVYLYTQGNKALGNQLINEGSELMRNSRTSLEESVTDPSLLSDLSDIEQFESKVIESAFDIIKTVDEPLPGQSEQANLLNLKLHQLEGRVEALNLRLSTLVETTDENVGESLQYSQARGMETINLTYYTIGGSLLISLLLALILTAKMTGPINALNDIANKVSKGDIHEKVDVTSNDEIGDLAESFKRMINAFKIMDALLKEEN